MAATGRLGEVRGFISGVYGPDRPAKRVDALAGAMLGVMAGASLAVAVIGQALAQARGLVTKHAVSLDALASGKQVDRPISNAGVDMWDSFARWEPSQGGTADPADGLEKGDRHPAQRLRGRLLAAPGRRAAHSP